MPRCPQQQVNNHCMSSALKNTALSLGKNPEQTSAKITAEGAGSMRLLGCPGCSTAEQHACTENQALSVPG